MKKDPQAADDQVEQVVQELHICDYRFVATSEGSTVPHKAHEEGDLVTQLQNTEVSHIKQTKWLHSTIFKKGLFSDR